MNFKKTSFIFFISLVGLVSINVNTNAINKNEGEKKTYVNIELPKENLTNAAGKWVVQNEDGKSSILMKDTNGNISYIDTEGVKDDFSIHTIQEENVPKSSSFEVDCSEQKLKSIGTFKITYYCSCEICCGKNGGKITKSGTNPTVGRTIAVDSSIIPIGTKVVIDGNTYIAEDTGSAVVGNVIDIYKASHEEAVNLGRQEKEVFIVKN